MNTNNLETGPRPLSRSEILDKTILGYEFNRVVVNYGRFNRYGMFSILYGDDPGRRVWDLELTSEGRFPHTHIGLPMWSSRLLDLDPESYVLRWLNNKKSFIATDQATGKISGIPLVSVRVIDDSISGVAEVGNSGYLLDMYRSSYDTEEKKRALDLKLANAENGIRPDVVQNSYYVKILEPEFVGRKVLFLEFSFNTITGIDGVVIDMDTKRLLRRSFEQPFSTSRWGAPSRSERSVDRFTIPAKSTFIPTKSYF